MEQFDELARGASELRVNLQRGDIVVRVVEGGEWGLDWSGYGGVEPEVERVGPAVEVRQRGGVGRSGPTRPSRGAAAGRGGIVGEVMTDVGGIVDEVGGIVDQVMNDVLGDGGPRGARLEVRLTLPAAVEVAELTTGWGRIEAEGLRGRLRLRSGFGSLVLRAARGEGEVSTGNGDVTIERYDGRLIASTGNGHMRCERLGGHVQIDAGNGRIEVAEAEGNLRAHTGNGDITVTAASGEAELNTGHGAIEIAAARGLTGEARTGAGAIRVEGGSLRPFRLNTMMGSLHLAAALAPGTYDVTSGMGSVTVELVPDVRARVDAQTGFGQVQSDFPLVRVGRSGPLGFGAVRMVGSIGEGEPQVELGVRSGKGEIVLRRAAVYSTPSTPSTPSAPPSPPTAPEGPQAPSAPPRETRSEDSTLAILESLARGEITPAQAEDLLSKQ